MPHDLLSEPSREENDGEDLRVALPAIIEVDDLLTLAANIPDGPAQIHARTVIPTPSSDRIPSEAAITVLRTHTPVPEACRLEAPHNSHTRRYHRGASILCCRMGVEYSTMESWVIFSDFRRVGV
jgi:hypothetical protein